MNTLWASSWTFPWQRNSDFATVTYWSHLYLQGLFKEMKMKPNKMDIVTLSVQCWGFFLHDTMQKRILKGNQRSL